MIVKRFLPLTLLSLATIFSTFTPLCGLIFSCGCRLTRADCNIHDRLAAHHCPWCVIPIPASSGTMLIICAAALVPAILLYRRSPRLLPALSVAMFGYAVAAAALSFLAAKHYDYPTWLRIPLTRQAEPSTSPTAQRSNTGCCGTPSDTPPPSAPAS